RREHRKALAALGLGERFGRVFLTGGGAEVVRHLLPGYAGATVHEVEEGSLRGVARLFVPGGTGPPPVSSGAGAGNGPRLRFPPPGVVKRLPAGGANAEDPDAAAS